MRKNPKWDCDKCMDRLYSTAVTRAFKALLPQSTHGTADRGERSSQLIAVHAVGGVTLCHCQNA